MTEKLVVFLEARLAEDEAVALAAANDKPEKFGRWAYAPDGEVYASDSSTPDGMGFMDYHYVTCDSEGLSPAVEPKQGAHIARFDPARMLLEIQSKRDLISYHEGGTCGLSDNGECLNCDLLGILAQVYSDHPDYPKAL